MTKSTATLCAATLALSACVQTGDPDTTTLETTREASAPGAASGGSITQEPHDHDDHDQDDHDSETASAAAAPTREAAGPSPRLALTYDGGVMVVDAMTLEVVGDLPAEGFTRLNPAGDGRHLFLTEGDSFRVLDAGTWSEPHANHDHSYTAPPRLGEARVEGSHPGHAVSHGGRTALYFDGDGRVDLVDPAHLDAEASRVEVERSYEVEEAHHGVALLLPDGSLLETVGTEEERTGARVLDSHGQEIASTQDCPGIHGEAVAADDVVVLGCQDGLIFWPDGEFSKVSSPDPYGRIGNQAGSPLSPVVLGDYKVDPDADLERPERVTLTDTTTGELTVIDLGASYSFRSLGRGPQGEALVLGTDGALHVIDPETGEVAEQVPVVSEWTEPEEWQQPRPTLFTLGQFAYVTEPATRELHVLDLDTLTVIDSTSLPRVPNELSGVTGRVESGEHRH